MDNYAKDPRPQQFDHATGLLAEQIKLLYQQASKAHLATLIISPAFAFISWKYFPSSWLLSWVMAIYALALGRQLLIHFYFHKKPSAIESVLWGRLFVGAVLLSGVLWGIAGGVFFVEDSPLHQLFLAYILGGMIAGAMATLSSYRGAFFAFSVPATVPFIYQVISHEKSGYLLIAFTYLFFLLMMVSISHQLYQTITDSLNLRFDNVDLLNRLLQAQNRQHAINMELQNQIAEKDLSQQALQHAKQQLEHRVAERTAELALSNEILQHEKELFQVTLASIGDAVITTNSSGKITFLNPIAELFTGWRNIEAQGLDLQQVFSILDASTQALIDNPLGYCSATSTRLERNAECLLISKDRSERIIDYSIAPILNNSKDIIGTVLTFRDVTEQRKLTQKLAYQAAHDSLTGLLNREEFENRLNKILASTRPHDTHALLYLDLDQFKVINDTCGHSAGDELLRQVTALLHSKLRTRDTLARLGGDEFGIILEHCPENEALQVANLLRELVENFRYQWQDKTFTIGVSIGLFPINQDNNGLESALSAADSACFAAKEQGRNRVHVYQTNDDLLQKRSGEMQWLPRLQKAIADHRLQLLFQPITAISHEDGFAEHGEFLLRLQDEQGQLILPGSFLPSAERYHQMLMIDRWVIEQSMHLLKTRQNDQFNVLYAINLSAHALGNEDFLDFVIDHLKAYHNNPATICFEITENVALADLQHVIKFIVTLKKLGCRFSMDDFGSGLSSFGYLKNIPLDYLKIDGRLVKGILTDPIDRAMVESINHIGHVMGLETIAEWVEDDQTSQLLKEIGVDYVQGYGIARPFVFHPQPEEPRRATVC
ncbi:EAL domain-containing protein [Nitrosomonas sp. JL21]|uniref:EAL domain-containing protein n=1 Tax=Nitrosomonas sp. JL21 TaxID=153949 RepID=UPI001370D1E1|nr:EAL domain-containing protein [Nitrosomonas sp. JL21]MBL8498761.1 EAL domain-containing protein [Nitrosomonas sp.]MXS78069.1 EAL domain-containing protein [Nitrosomonas sp. JL21]